jgi:putative endonuclease
MDVVTTRDAVWVFVQVRTRRGSRCGRPEESIDQAKADRLIRIGQSYLQDHAIEGVDWRVDLVAVEMDATGRLLRVEQLESAVGGW